MAGDVVDNQQRFQTRSDGPPAGGSAEFFEPNSDGHGYHKADAPPNTSAGKRLRRQPKVIDARENKGDDANLLQDQGAPAGDDKGPEWEALQGRTREDPEWQEAQREKKPDFDLPPPPEPKPAAPAAEPKAKAAPKPTAAPTAPPAPKPAVKPAETKKKKKPPSPKHASQVVARTMVNSMVDRMREEAKRKGSLTLADIEAMQADFDRQAQKLGQALERTFDDFIEHREREEWGLKRDLPFDRVIVKSFSELFMEDDYSRFDRVSRRMLPGFFMALNMMLGEELVEEYQEHCRLIVERLREARGDNFEWDEVYTDPEARALLLDAAVTIATFFKNYDRRSQWFMDLINGHLGPMDGAPREEGGWEMTPAAFKRFLDHLFKDLRAELETDSGKLRITKRHGADVCADIFEILEAIEA